MSVPPAFAQTLQGNILSRANLLLFVREFLRECQVEPGAYVEFGVLNGESIRQSYAILRGSIARFIGYDTFDGIPELSLLDQHCKALHPRFTEENFRSAGIDVVRRYLESSGIPAGQLKLVPGDIRAIGQCDFEQHLGGSGPRATVVHIDVDLHSSTLAALELVVPHAIDGSWFLFDDYWCYRGSPACGVQRALSEFTVTHPTASFTPYANYNGWGRVFIFHNL